MNKRIVTLALAASSLGLLGTGLLSGAHAASVSPGGTCTNQTNNSATGTSQDAGAPSPAPNIYTSGSSPTSGSGYVGVSGSHGYLEAGGSATGGGYVSGATTDAPQVNGAVNVSQSTQNACFSGVQVP